MTFPKVSVIIPAYNGGTFLVEAVRSVLSQSYPHFELIVVDDRSPESVARTLAEFTDPRLTCLVHDTNKGAVAARHTGVRAASGDIIAFLDQDDLYHPDKLLTHVRFLERHPDVGVTYNARFEVEADTRAIRSIWQPPETMTLGALVLGFPFSPSDTVLRRELALQDDIWDQSYVRHDGEMIFNGAEIILGCRLAMSGAAFANVGRVLNYRRYHPHRVFKGLSSRCRAERTCQELIFDDRRCPPDVRALRDEALMSTYRIWAYYAFAQGETTVGQSFVREAVRLTPSLVEGRPCELVNFMVDCSATDASVDLQDHLTRIVDQFPLELSSLSSHLVPALAQGYLAKGSQALLFERLEEGGRAMERARRMGARVDEPFVQRLTHQLLCYETEFGAQAAQVGLSRLAGALDALERGAARRLRGNYSVNEAFRSYRNGSYRNVPVNVVQAIARNPRYLWNRGVLAILVRSTVSVGLDGRH